MCLALLAIGLQRFGLHAEPPPGPPLVATAPDPIAWTIDVRQKKPRQAAPADPKQARIYKRLVDIYPLLVRETVEKSGKDWHREKVFDNQTKENIWVRNGIVVYQYHYFPPERVIAVSVSDHISPVKGGFGPDFPELYWIRAEAFVKSEMYGGHLCYYYEDKNARPLQGGDALAAVPQKGNRAWIDAKTRLPIAMEDDTMLKTYTYHQSAVNIQLTGVFATAYQKALETAKQPE